MKSSGLQAMTKQTMNRDEYPPAMFLEGGAGASVKYVHWKDNQSAGSYIGIALRNKKDGTKVIIRVVD